MKTQTARSDQELSKVLEAMASPCHFNGWMNEQGAFRAQIVADQVYMLAGMLHIPGIGTPDG